jgi:hypothetical protein
MAARPPAGTTPAEFFEQWLPRTFAAKAKAGLADAPTVRVTLSGPGGGDWRVHAGEDGLDVERVSTGRAPDPDLWIRQPTADFVAAFDGDADLPELLPPTWSALDLLFLDARDVELARQIDGRLLLEIAGKRRRRWALDLGFGKSGVGAGRPRATVRVDGATYEGLRTRTVAPMQALLDGRIKIEGDRALAMQVMLLTASRLAR